MGFCDLSHLNRVVKAQLGCLPGGYRARRREGVDTVPVVYDPGAVVENRLSTG
ncbi:AraC family transcriptional regulator [Pseudonocardia oroxyli]|uniref:HTH araC/xylS-type domain-containing protein n=1 Tax=Pseudonocardia oroxyli TaxID=366584 RepID=A0A1G7WLK0_PSEOR|nr:AraC family transcriptional regulator [Pseudonocardia oroxyli]SDG72867.1 hypothetical protein SAMN05216377_114173 [Pseudonocardia oroxyli]